MSVLFPLPVKDQPDDDLRDNDHISKHGSCAWWCSEQLDNVIAESGNTIAEHGDDPYCVHSVSDVLGMTEDAKDRYVDVALIRPYMHGVYERDAYATAEQLSFRRASIQLSFDDGFGAAKETSVYLSTGDARSLAAILLKAADEREGINRPMRRKGDR